MMDQCQRDELNEMYKKKMKDINFNFDEDFINFLHILSEKTPKVDEDTIRLFIDKWVEVHTVMQKFDEEGKPYPNWLEVKKMLEEAGKKSGKK